MTPRQVAATEALTRVVLKGMILPLIPTRLLEWLIGLQVDQRVARWGVSARFRREVMFLCLRGWILAKTVRRVESRRILARCDELEVDYLYVTSKTYPDLVTEGIALRKAFRGDGVLLVLQRDGMADKECDQTFRTVISVRSNFYLMALAVGRLRYNFAATRTAGGMTWHLPFFLATVRSPYLYRASGFMSQTADEANDYINGPWKHDVPAIEREAVARAAFVMHNYNEDAIEELQQSLRLTKPVSHLMVRPGVHPEIVARHVKAAYEPAPEVSVVYCGGFVSPSNYVAKHLNLIPFWKQLADGGIHVHVYYSHKKRTDPRLGPVRDLLDGHPYFHLYDPVPFWQLLERMQLYDFLWAYFAGTMQQYKDPFKKFVSANLALPMCAGVPAIVNSSLPMLHEIVKRDGNGIALEYDANAPFVDIIKCSDRAKLRATAVRVREQFWFPEAKFIERVQVAAGVTPVAAVVGDAGS